MVQIEPYESNYFLDSDKDPSIIPDTVGQYEQPYAQTYSDLSFDELAREVAIDSFKYKRPNRMHAIALGLMNYFPYRNVLTQARFASKMYECYILSIVDRMGLSTRPQVIFMCPTLEFAHKINEQFLKISKLTEFLCRVVDASDLSPGPEFVEHIIIGMPSTIRQLILMAKLDLSYIRMLVVEKVDHIVQVSMGDDTHAVMCDVDPNCQYLLFYGTNTDKVKEFVENRLDKWEWDKIFVNEEEFCISRLKMFHIELPDEKTKALTIREIFNIIPKSTQVIIYIDPKTDLKYMREALYDLNVAVPELGTKESVEQVYNFKHGVGRVLITCVPPTTGFDDSKVNLLIFHDIPMIRNGPDYELYYRLAAQVGRNIHEDIWSDEIAGFKGYCVLHLLSKKQEVLMTNIKSHFGRSVTKLTDAMCGGSAAYGALELGGVVRDRSIQTSSEASD